MTPPEAAPDTPHGPEGAMPPAASFALVPLRRRGDFLRAARAARAARPGLILQARRRGAGEAGACDPAAIRVGFTCSKKLGNAVARNRAKRRLRAAARAVLPFEGRPGWDYVLIGRPGATASRDFAALAGDLRGALARLHRAPAPGGAS